jgi:flagellar motor protein MotB
MARLKKVEIGGGHAVEKDESEKRWLISYSDFMMQLVCLFILLYSVSALDKGKMALVAAYYRASIGLGEPPVQEAPSRGKTLAVGDRALVGGRDGRVDIPPGVQYKVEPVPGGFLVNFTGTLFDAGGSGLLPGAAKDLDDIATRFRAYAGSVFVTATAAPGPADAGGVDAMTLSQWRAEAVAARLTRDGFAGAFDPRFLQVTGKLVPAAEARRASVYVRVK